jgi:hypothetical protein
MWLLEPLHVGRGAQPTAPEAGALPETGRYRVTFQKSKSYRLLVLGGSHCGAGILPAAIFPPYSDLRMHDNNLTIGCRQRLARTGSDLGKGGGQNARATFFSAWLRLRRITLS